MAAKSAVIPGTGVLAWESSKGHADPAGLHPQAAHTSPRARRARKMIRRSIAGKGEPEG